MLNVSKSTVKSDFELLIKKIAVFIRFKFFKERRTKYIKIKNFNKILGLIYNFLSKNSRTYLIAVIFLRNRVHTVCKSL